MQLDTTEEHNTALLTKLDEHLLCLLASEGIREAQDILLSEEQLPLQAQDKDGRKALHIVVEKELHNILPLLLDRNPIPGLNDQDYHNRTPLEIALTMGNAPMTELLCGYGADHVKSLNQVQNTTQTSENSLATEAFFIGIVKKQNKPEDNGAGGGCLICLDEMEYKKACIHKSCSAAFHQKCISDYRPHSTNCPSCQEYTKCDDYVTLDTIKKLLKPALLTRRSLLSKILG